MVHFLFLGHFEHEDGFIAFSRGDLHSSPRPVTTRPLDARIIEQIVREVLGTVPREGTFPPSWRIDRDGDYLVCDKYTLDPNAIEFIARLAKRTACDIADYSAATLLDPENVIFMGRAAQAPRT